MSSGWREGPFVAPRPRGAVDRGPRPSFSVVIAAYQAADVVGEAIRSVVEQTEPPEEVIVADDGSTDDVAAAVRPFGDRVRLLGLPHGGAARATNAAVVEAHGDYAVVQDADDFWEPERLARMADLLELRPDLDVVTTDAWFWRDGRRGRRYYDLNEFETEDQASEILRRTFVFGHVAVRRRRWLELGGFTEELARGYDWDLQLRLLHTGSAIGCVMEPLATYVIHERSLTADRAESMAARVALLDRAEREQNLSPQQWKILDHARRQFRQRGLQARAERALLDRSPDRRRAVGELVRSPLTGHRQRILMAAALVAPEWAGRRVRRRARESGRTATERAIE